jgi:hypothetical protein
LTTLRRHGRAHFVAAGKRGFDTTCARHWAGDRAAYVQWLHERGFLADVARTFDAQCAEAQACGATGPWSIEIPLLPSEEEERDDDPLEELRRFFDHDLLTYVRTT